MSKKYQRILSLGEERVAVVNNQLANGASAQTVARLIQQEWKEFQDVAEKTLMQQLLRYRSDMIVSPVVNQQLAIKEESKKGKELEKRMDVLGEMIDLARAHRRRIDGFLEREKDLKMPIKGTSEDIRMLMDMFKDIQKTQFDLGVDLYQGPVLQAGRQVNTRTTLPDGTTVESSLTEAVQGALEVLDDFKKGKVIEGESSVVAPSKG